MNEWFASLEPRERVILVGGAAAALLVVLFVFVLAPLNARTAALEQSVASKQRLLVDLARAQGVAATGGSVGRLESMYVIVDKTSTRHGIPLTDSRADGADGLRAFFDDVPFDALAAWLVTLNNEHSVRVELLDVRRNADGIVAGNVVLRRS